MTIEQKVQESLTYLEQQRNIEILLAVESGSRAWGFPSKDSDYDVRIIYVHPKEHYLSIFDRKDTVEVPITDELDIAGWDVSKALKLMYAGNAVIHEWLNSPIIYRQNLESVQQLKNFAKRGFNTTKAFHHYLAMSAKKFDLENGERFTAKRLLYAFRTLLCAQWVKEHQCAPPMLFQNLIDSLLTSEPSIVAELNGIIDLKQNQLENQDMVVSDRLINYASSKLKDLKSHSMEKYKAPQKAAFDELFLTIVKQRSQS